MREEAIGAQHHPGPRFAGAPRPDRGHHIGAEHYSGSLNAGAGGRSSKASAPQASHSARSSEFMAASTAFAVSMSFATWAANSGELTSGTQNCTGLSPAARSRSRYARTTSALLLPIYDM